LSEATLNVTSVMSNRNKLTAIVRRSY